MTKIPYFLWDYDLTEKDVTRILRSNNEKAKSWITTRILESAKYEDIWRFLSLDEVKKYPSLKLKKPIKDAWDYAFSIWY